MQEAVDRYAREVLAPQLTREYLSDGLPDYLRQVKETIDGFPDAPAGNKYVSANRQALEDPFNGGAADGNER